MSILCMAAVTAAISTAAEATALLLVATVLATGGLAQQQPHRRRNLLLLPYQEGLWLAATPRARVRGRRVCKTPWPRATSGRFV